ncbi:HAD family hydrolase [Nonomuraea rubra]|uniref:HAD family hydrolase n=1 Tax=Nonomuraea rubra TaxID=46180 RepID=UPI00360FD11C
MSDVVPIKLACLDLAGTTVGDIAMVERAFAEAIATQGIVPGTGAYARAMVHVHRSRGCPKIDVFRGIFPGNEAQAQAANLTFERSYEGALERAGLVPMPGVLEVLDKLRGTGIKLALITGFSRTTLSRILSVLGWHDKIDLAISPKTPAAAAAPGPTWSSTPYSGWKCPTYARWPSSETRRATCSAASEPGPRSWRGS